MRPATATAAEKGHKKDASQVDHRAAAAAKMEAATAAAASEEEALLTSEFYEGINVKVELMLSSDDDTDDGDGQGKKKSVAEPGGKVQVESETSDVVAAEGGANSKAETAINSICGASGCVRATSAGGGAGAANGKQQQQQQLWTVKDKKLSLVIVKSAACESGDGDERCNHRSGIIGGGVCDLPPSPSPPPQSSRECSDHSGHLHCYRSNLVSGGGAGDTGDKRCTAEKVTVTVGVSANGESGGGKKKAKKRKRLRRKRNDGDGGEGSERRQTTTMSSSRSMSVFSSFISRTHSRRWGRRGSAGSADQQKSYMSNNGGVTTLRMNFSAAASVSADGSQNRAMSHTPASALVLWQYGTST